MTEFSKEGHAVVNPTAEFQVGPTPVASYLSGNSTTARDWINDQIKCSLQGEHITVSLTSNALLLSVRTTGSEDVSEIQLT